MDGIGTRSQRDRLTGALLLCGVLSSVVHVAVDLFTSAVTPGYSYVDQTVSELSAIGAPTRGLWMALTSVYEPLLLAFAWGVWRAGRGRRWLRASAIMLLGVAATGVTWGFFPMHLRGDDKTFTDTMHVLLTGPQAVFSIGAMAFGAAALGRRFRIYSIATIVALLVGGALTGLVAPAIATGGATPWIGLFERVNVYGYLLWVLILAVTLRHARGHADQLASGHDDGPLAAGAARAGG
jgi:hypothetical protein